MNELTKRYALGLYSLKKEENRLAESQKEIIELINILKENSDYLSLLDSRYLSVEKRLILVDEAFSSLDPEILNFIKIIIENNRGLYLLDILTDFNSLVNEYLGIKEGLLYASTKLSDEQVDSICKAISAKENRKIELKLVVDPSLLGGVKVVIDDRIYDGTLLNRLEKMKAALLK